MARKEDLDSAKRDYERLEKQREARVAKNLAEGRSIENIIAKGTPMTGSTIKKNVKTLSEVPDSGIFKQNVSDTKKIADEAIGHAGMDAELRNRNMIQNIAEEAGKELEQNPSTLSQLGEKLGIKGSKFSSVLPVVGMAAALAPTLYSAGAKASEGDLMGAAKEGAGLASDLVMPIGTQSTDAGAGSTDVEGKKPYNFSKFKTLQDKLNGR